MKTLLSRVAAAGLLAGVLVAAPAPAHAADSYTFTNTTNPILGDGTYYSADPAPLVVPAGAPETAAAATSCTSTPATTRPDRPQTTSS
ncbi:hypothetical protein ACFQ1L_18465 [Phytohabitans flavus]|uniref:hypothetical protein n=1 Tax=Phytohabitans flavus TaxID=1076124 RepID=UPI003636C10E